MLNFFLGVLATIIGSVIILLFRTQFKPLINFVFSNIYPNVQGEYYLYPFYKNTKKELFTNDGLKIGSNLSNEQILESLKKDCDIEKIERMHLKQFAYLVSGYTYVLKNGEKIKKEKFNGKVMPSRVLMLNSESVDDNCFNFLTYLLSITNDKRVLKGSFSFICVSCNEIDNYHVMLEKIN